MSIDRERLAAIRKRHVRTPEGPDDYCTGCGDLWPCDAIQLADAYEAAPGDSLDVERLAEAISNVPGLAMRLDTGQPQAWVEGAIAAAIASEYAKLATLGTPGAPES